MKIRAVAATTAAALALTIAPVATTAAFAADHKPVTLTSQELTEWGYPVQPKVVGWKAKVAPAKSAKAGEAVVVTGKAPSYVEPGTVLTLGRLVPENKKGDAITVDLPATTTVNKDGSFKLVMRVSMKGTHGYRLGHVTDSESPEFEGIYFQHTTK